MKRTDIHRPSAINPQDYQYVAEEYMKVADLGSALCLKAQRDIIDEHRANHPGVKYSGHEHGGNCMVCGSVNAIYTSLFYHPGTNTYVRMGHDCADKCYMGGAFQRNSFRRAVESAREHVAGKNKARLLLADKGLSKAWELYEMPYESLPLNPNAPRKIWTGEGEAVVNGFHNYKEEITVRDIVGNFVRYGSISEKAEGYIVTLLKRIEERPEREAKIAAEKAAAADCPKGKVVIEGEILSTRVDDTPYGSVVKMLVKHASGFKVWGTMPGSLSADKGDMVKFSATVEPSPTDPKFGFFKRPTKASVVLDPAKEAERERQEEAWSLAADMLDAQHAA